MPILRYRMLGVVLALGVVFFFVTGIALLFAATRRSVRKLRRSKITCFMRKHKGRIWGCVFIAISVVLGLLAVNVVFPFATPHTAMAWGGERPGPEIAFFVIGVVLMGWEFYEGPKTLEKNNELLERDRRGPSQMSLRARLPAGLAPAVRGSKKKLEKPRAMLTAAPHRRCQRLTHPGE